jgi:uncharacterized protein YbjT (DUF2867 family)
MKILVLGATGRTGKYVLAECIRNGYEITCLVRDAKRVKVSHPTLTVLEGSPANASVLELAMQGCHVVISTLNISRHSDFPWSKLRTPPMFMSDVIRNVISLSAKHDIKRIIVCSAWGASETKKELPGWFRWFIDNSNIGFAYRDHERQEEILKRSTLAWTIVRPTGLINTKRAQKIMESYSNNPKPAMTISRRSVAKYLVDAVSDDSLIHKTPVISGRQFRAGDNYNASP